MVTGLKQKLDYSDYARIPPDGKRYELLAGELYVTPAPSPPMDRRSCCTLSPAHWNFV